jgi:methionine-rich copper-binding protein CopC
MPFRARFFVTFAALGLTFAPAAPAVAHATLAGSSPADKSLVSEVSEVSITANEELLDIGKNAKGFVIAVKDRDGAFYGDGCISVRGDTATMPIELTRPGKYSVSYRVISNDGHPVEGKFTFEFTGGLADAEVVRYSERPECGKPAPAFVDETIPTGEPSPAATVEPTATEATDFDVTPWIGLATIPLVIGAIAILIRMLGKRDSEDHLT